jgi:hypothetical protein
MPWQRLMIRLKLNAHVARAPWAFHFQVPAMARDVARAVDRGIASTAHSLKERRS